MGDEHWKIRILIKMKFSILFTLSSILFLLTGCFGPSRPAPVSHYGTHQGAGSVGAHTVSSGDTLYSIAQRYNVRMEDLKIANSLSSPDDLEIGQRLKMPAPKTYKLRQEDTLYFLSYMFDVDVEETAALNNIRDPMNLQAGRILKLPSLAAEPPEIIAQTRFMPPQPPEAVEREELSDVTPERKPSSPVASARQDRAQNIPSKPKSKIHVDTPKRASSKFLQPVEGRIISSYGPTKDGLHNDGINIAAARGTPVKAAENGVVVYAGNGLKGSGNLVLVRHDNRWMTAYAHLDRIDVQNGATIMRGSKLGTVGSSGAVSTPQLHFEVRRGTEALNPKPYLGG